MQPLISPPLFLCQGIAGRPRPCAYQGAKAKDILNDRAALGEGATGGGVRGGGGQAVTHHDRGHEAAAGRGDGGALAGVSAPRPSPRAQAGSLGEPVRWGHETVEAPAGSDSAPRRGRSRGSSGLAPERTPEVLVVRSDGCVMLQ
jgi:hypothetical protein